MYTLQAPIELPDVPDEEEDELTAILIGTHTHTHTHIYTYKVLIGRLHYSPLSNHNLERHDLMLSHDCYTIVTLLLCYVTLV
jgi:hypothetical protein